MTYSFADFLRNGDRNRYALVGAIAPPFNIILLSYLHHVPIQLFSM